MGGQTTFRKNSKNVVCPRLPKRKLSRMAIWLMHMQKLV